MPICGAAAPNVTVFVKVLLGERSSLAQGTSKGFSSWVAADIRSGETSYGSLHGFKIIGEVFGVLERRLKR